MPVYTFHPCRPDGTSDTFLALDLRGDHEVEVMACDLLVQHPSCACIEVFQEDRRVGEFHRAGATVD
ncbi:hypothetical protein LRS10_15865 [Phenylobacterium sp. J426]|uniref:hypothetical protein n=1 Tax=Phenylobacterium sp. J426 TaxID=2898439 RepID=UPI002150A34F|nr:hypothetical protein [Phenylobacterium sp. J426]MCR5875527.1 hypothetical protein [Phenylobacterium sp. J426]